MASNSNGNGNGHLVHNEPEARPSRGPWSAIRTMVTNIVYDRLQAFSRWLDPRRSIEHECGYPSRVIDPDFYQELYERDPIAARVVDMYPKECWQVQPSVYEDDDPDTNTRWEDAFAGLGAQLAGESYHGEEKGSLFWDAVRRADIASRVCRYGAVVVLLDDGNPLDPSGAHLQTPARMRPYKPLKGSTGSKGGVAAEQAKANGEEAEEVEEDEDRGEEEEEAATENQQQFSTAFPYNPMYPGENEVLVPPGMVKERLAKAGRNGKGKGGDGAAERRLLGLHVFTEAQCRIQEYDQNPASPRFGQPLLYSVTFGDPRQTMGPNMPLVQTTVHWTRVIPLAEDLRGSGPQSAAPSLEPVLNRILDLRKVYGPDAEGYYRNGIPGWAFETHKELGSADLDKESLKDAWEEYSNSMTRLMATEGGTLKPLTTSLADPKPHIEIQIEAICIKLGVPVRVFKGSERGELASSQDDAAWNDRLRERQHNYLTPKVICPIIDRLIALYVLPVPESPDGYKVWWPDLESQGAAEKATIASTQVTALATFFDPAKGVFNEMAPMDFWTKVMGYDEDEAKAIIRNAEKEKAKRQKEADELKVKEQEQQLAFQDAEARAGMERDMEFQAQQAEQAAAQEAAAAAPAEGGNVAGGTPVGAEGADALMSRLTTENEAFLHYYSGFRYDPVTNQFCRAGKGGGINPPCSPKKGTAATTDPTANRPSLPAERVPGTAPQALPWREPPPKEGKTGVGKPGRPTGDASQVRQGDIAEARARELGFRNILPAGKRNHTAAEVKAMGSSIDLEFDHSGKAYELKICKTTSTEYRLKAKKEEKEEKERYARNKQLTPYTMVGVHDVKNNQVHFYVSKEPGLTGAEVSRKNFDFVGTTVWDRSLPAGPPGPTAQPGPAVGP